MGAYLLHKFNLASKALVVFVFYWTASCSLLFSYDTKLGDELEKYCKSVQILPDILHTQGRCVLYLPSIWQGLAAGILCG